MIGVENLNLNTTRHEKMFNLYGVIFCLGFGSGFVIYYLILSIRAEIERDDSYDYIVQKILEAREDE